MSLSVGLFIYTSDVSNFEESPLREKRFSYLLDQSDLLDGLTAKNLKRLEFQLKSTVIELNMLCWYLSEICLFFAGTVWSCTPE